ncbi:MAG: hypothetical protein M1830_005153, partial [Pleopsidium flavum]
MIRGTPDAQPNGLRRRPREISLQEFQDRDYGHQITGDEWDNNLNFGTDELQDHVFEHSDVDSIRRTENEMTKRVFLNGENIGQHGDTRKSWITRWREMRKRYKMSDIGRSSASPDAHGSRGHGVYDLEQLKVAKPGDEADGVIVEDLIN